MFNVLLCAIQKDIIVNIIIDPKALQLNTALMRKKLDSRHKKMLLHLHYSIVIVRPNNAYLECKKGKKKKLILIHDKFVCD